MEHGGLGAWVVESSVWEEFWGLQLPLFWPEFSAYSLHEAMGKAAPLACLPTMKNRNPPETMSWDKFSLPKWLLSICPQRWGKKLTELLFFGKVGRAECGRADWRTGTHDIKAQQKHTAQLFMWSSFDVYNHSCVLALCWISTHNAFLFMLQKHHLEDKFISLIRFEKLRLLLTHVHVVHSWKCTLRGAALSYIESISVGKLVSVAWRCELCTGDHSSLC